MRKVVAVSLALFTISVIACNMIPAIVAPPVKVAPWSSLAEKWQKIGNGLDSIFGNAFQADEIISVRVPVQTCIGSVCGTATFIQFLKPCGQTLKQAAYQISTYGPGGGSGGGGGGGGIGGDPGGGSGGVADFPFQGCEPYTIQSCIGNNCRWDSYITCSG